MRMIRSSFWPAEQIEKREPTMHRQTIPASKVLMIWKNTVFCGRRWEGGLDFPGGWALPLETPRECALRELQEETELIQAPTGREIEAQLSAQAQPLG